MEYVLFPAHSDQNILFCWYPFTVTEYNSLLPTTLFNIHTYEMKVLLVMNIYDTGLGGNTISSGIWLPTFWSALFLPQLV
jgi:hypothetical protein